jgi:hypothetical protein
MAAQAEVQALLRFLTKEAHLPLAQSMKSINQLRSLQLQTPEAIAKAQSADLKTVFDDEKLLKQVLNAARRVTRGKTSPSTSRSSPQKKQDVEIDDETALTLPLSKYEEQELSKLSVETNRAPLFLAFALVVLEHTQSQQPVSSRLSLAQAVVSAGAQSKAKSIGLTSLPTAEEDGWAQGQPKIRIMGREIAVMRRHIPPPVDTKEVKSAEPSHDAFWGLDLEALRNSNGPLVASQGSGGREGPPIHKPQAARNYLLRSMDLVSQSTEDPHITNQSGSPSAKKGKKPAAAEIMARKEEAAAIVLKALRIVCGSWKDSLTPDELDRRAQTWYAITRPEVAQGQAGWGQRGVVQIQNILKLKRTP